MGFIQLLASLWPFLREMFVGKKIKVSVSNGDDDADSTKEVLIKDRRTRNNIYYWCMGKMQGSQRFLAVILLVLALSLFINYKVISKLSTVVLPPRNNEEKLKDEVPSLKEPKRTTTIPNDNSSDKDILLNQTVEELKNIYGGP